MMLASKLSDLLFYLLISVAPIAGYPSPTVLSEAHISLAYRYAPEFRFTTKEEWFPTSIEHMLPYFTAKDEFGKDLLDVPSPLLSSNLNQIHGQEIYLSVSNASFTNPVLKGQLSALHETPTYAFIVPKANEVVDIFYWLYFPFNRGKHVVGIGHAGDHVGDWEMVRVRTVGGNAVSVEYGAHGDYGVGEVQWDMVKKSEEKNGFVAYIAEGSHGTWPDAGEWTFVSVAGYHLTDLAEGGGPVLNSKNNLVPILYLPNGGYGGELAWLDFEGRWGNKGSDNCGWARLARTCHFVSGPVGPARQSMLLEPKTYQNHTMIAKDEF